MVTPETKEEEVKDSDILDLDYLVDPPRRKIRLGGKIYEIINPLELSPLQNAWVSAQHKRISELMDEARKEDFPSEDLQARLEKLERDTLKVIIPDLTEEVLSKLKSRDNEKIVIILSFLGSRLPAVAKEAIEKDQQTGEKLSPSYNGSTERETP